MCINLVASLLKAAYLQTYIKNENLNIHSLCHQNSEDALLFKGQWNCINKIKLVAMFTWSLSEHIGRSLSIRGIMGSTVPISKDDFDQKIEQLSLYYVFEACSRSYNSVS